MKLKIEQFPARVAKFCQSFFGTLGDKNRDMLKICILGCCLGRVYVDAILECLVEQNMGFIGILRMGKQRKGIKEGKNPTNPVNKNCSCFLKS